MKKTIFILSFFLIIYTPYIVHGETPYDIIESIEETQGINTKEITRGVLSGKLPVTFSGVIEMITDIFLSGIKENLPQIIKISTLAILSGLILNIGGEKNETGVFATVAVVAAFSVKIFSYTVSVTRETIDSLFIFVQSLMTPIATVATTSGVSTGGAAASVFISMQVFIHICESVFLPLICIITVFSVSDKFGEMQYLEGINKILKQLLKWGTGLMITVYSVVIALQIQTAASFDTLAGKSIKYAVGSFMPVVGGALSDSLETVITSAKTVGSALGIAGIIGIGYICVVPLVNVCCVALSFRIAAAIATVGTEKRVSSTINEMGDAIGKVAVLLISVGVMFIISLAMLINPGGTV